MCGEHPDALHALRTYLRPGVVQWGEYPDLNQDVDPTGFYVVPRRVLDRMLAPQGTPAKEACPQCGNRAALALEGYYSCGYCGRDFDPGSPRVRASAESDTELHGVYGTHRTSFEIDHKGRAWARTTGPAGEESVVIVNEAADAAATLTLIRNMADLALGRLAQAE